MNSRQKDITLRRADLSHSYPANCLFQLYQSQLLPPIATSADDPYGKTDGSDKNNINHQLFIDTFLTVIVSFLLSLLITHDLIPIFNSITSGKIETSFFL